MSKVITKKGSLMDCISLYTQCRTTQVETMIFILRKGKGEGGLAYRTSIEA